MIAYSEKKKETEVSLQANVIETLICGYLLVLRTKDIFWVQIVRNTKIFAKG
jgi:hypothetical protein